MTRDYGGQACNHAIPDSLRSSVLRPSVARKAMAGRAWNSEHRICKPKLSLTSDFDGHSPLRRTKSVALAVEVMAEVMLVLPASHYYSLGYASYHLTEK